MVWGEFECHPADLEGRPAADQAVEHALFVARGDIGEHPQQGLFDQAGVVGGGEGFRAQDGRIEKDVQPDEGLLKSGVSPGDDAAEENRQKDHAGHDGADAVESEAPFPAVAPRQTGIHDIDGPALLPGGAGGAEWKSYSYCSLYLRTT